MIPLTAYQESINASLLNQQGIPSWYVCLEDQKIIGGLGVIENDFHEWKDLSSNVSAVYVEKPYRHQGIAGALLDYVCKDMKTKGYTTLCLVTDHTNFYERYGWKFLCEVKQGDILSRMYVHQEE